MNAILRMFPLLLWVAGLCLFAVCAIQSQSGARKAASREPVRLFFGCYLAHLLCVAVILLTLHLHLLSRRASFYVDATLLGVLLIALAVSLVPALDLTKLKTRARLASSTTLAAFPLLIAHPRHMF